MNILLGRYYSAHDTGNYNQAYQWNNKCTSLIQGMVKQVDQAVLVSVRDDQERQLAVLRKMVRFAAFISFPLLLGFGLVAKEFIVLAIGEKWLVSAHYLQWLCVCGAVAEPRLALRVVHVCQQVDELHLIIIYEGHRALRSRCRRCDAGYRLFHRLNHQSLVAAAL